MKRATNKMLAVAMLFGTLIISAQNVQGDEPQRRATSPASAGQIDAQMLALLGLGDTKAVTDEEGMQIRGKGSLWNTITNLTKPTPSSQSRTSRKSSSSGKKRGSGKKRAQSRR